MTTVPKLHTFQLLLFVHKVIHHPEKLPEAFQDYFEINSTFHGHHTRSTNNIHIFRVKLVLENGPCVIKLHVCGMTYQQNSNV